jgi:hypothetical protein
MDADSGARQQTFLWRYHNHVISLRNAVIRLATALVDHSQKMTVASSATAEKRRSSISPAHRDQAQFTGAKPLKCCC